MTTDINRAGRGSKAPDGGVAILNVGGGDITLSFDPSNQAERIRAARIVKDMIRRGFALLIEVDGKWVRATDFREDICCYVIADFDSAEAAKQDATGGGTEHGDNEHDEAEPGRQEDGEKKAPRKGARKPRVVDAGSTRAVAVARSAGG